MHWDINTWINLATAFAFPAIVYVWRSLKGEFKQRDEKIETVRTQAASAIEAVRMAANATVEGAEAKVMALTQSFNDYRVEVSEKYATNAYLREVEARIAQRFDVIDKKLDRLIERNQRRDGDT